MFALRAQSQLGPVICGNKKVRRSGFRPLIKPKAQNRPTQSQAYICCNGIRSFKIIQRKEREKHPREASFPSLSGALLEVLKGHISKTGETVFQIS
jgi:hypothetical protein